MNDEEYAAYTAKMRREDIVEGAGMYINCKIFDVGAIPLSIGL